MFFWKYFTTSLTILKKWHLNAPKNLLGYFRFRLFMLIGVYWTTLQSWARDECLASRKDKTTSRQRVRALVTHTNPDNVKLKIRLQHRQSNKMMMMIFGMQNPNASMSNLKHVFYGLHSAALHPHHFLLLLAAVKVIIIKIKLYGAKIIV